MFKQRMIAAVTVAGLTVSMGCAVRASAQVQASPLVSDSAQASTHAQTAGEPKLAYEVATIKPAEGNGPGIPLRAYIQAAFGIPVNSKGWVIGPEWIEGARYMIQGKPPDSVRNAMQTMSADERMKENRQMEQSLLADRFQLKAHFETRELPKYELVIAKGGPKLKENPDRTQGRAGISSSGIRGTAVPMRNLIDFLMSVQDVGGRVVINKTGLTGTYDVSLKWAPMSAGNGGAESPADADAPSFFTAIEEQLGLKLVPTDGPGQVLVIDHIERPSEN